MKRTLKFGGGSIPIWAVISHQGFVCWNFYEGRLNTDKYIELLEDNFEPALDQFWPEGCDGILTFMQDNASPHLSERAEEYLSRIEAHWDFKMMD
jgi:hypothetical protein